MNGGMTDPSTAELLTEAETWLLRAQIGTCPPILAVSVVRYLMEKASEGLLPRAA